MQYYTLPKRKSYSNQRVIYSTVPNRNTDINSFPRRTPNDLNLEYQEHIIETRDSEKLHAWLITTHCPTIAPTIVYFHGNTGNIGHRMEYYYNMHQHLEINIFTVDYRGFGKSTGTPSERGLEIDAECVVEYILKLNQIDPTKVFLYGKNLGAALAIYAAKKFQHSV